MEPSSERLFQIQERWPPHNGAVARPIRQKSAELRRSVSPLYQFQPLPVRRFRNSGIKQCHCGTVGRSVEIPHMLLPAQTKASRRRYGIPVTQHLASSACESPGPKTEFAWRMAAEQESLSPKRAGAAVSRLRSRVPGSWKGKPASQILGNSAVGDFHLLAHWLPPQRKTADLSLA